MIVSKDKTPRIIDVHREMPGAPIMTGTENEILPVREKLICLKIIFF